MKRQSESGSALWFVLLAVILLAVLTVVLTRSSETSEQNGSIEQQKIAVSSIIRYGAGLEESIERMRMRGLSENAISFETTALAGYANAHCPDTSCQLFHAAGGGMTYNKPPSGANDGSDWLFTGANAVADVGGADNELLMILPNVNKALCTEVNAENGVTGIPQAAGKVDIVTKFTGGFPTPLTIDVPDGKKTGCFEGNQDGAGAAINGRYFLYHTLIAR